MARTLTTSSAERTIALCEQGIYEPCEGSRPLDLLARGMVEMHTGNLESAKDLLSQAYWKLDGEQRDKAGVQLAYVYWMGGEKAEAAALLDTLPASFDVLLMQAIIEMEADPAVALKTLERAEAYDVSRYKWGRLHNLRGICFRRLGQHDRAEEEYQAALFFFGDCPLRAQVETNWSYAIGDTSRAHAKLDHAITDLNGPCLAQAYDLKAKTYLTERQHAKALQYAEWAVGLLEGSNRRAWLIDALLTRSEALEKLDRHGAAFNDLLEAYEVAEFLGDTDLKIKTGKQVCAFSRSVSTAHHKRNIQIALRASDSLNSAARRLGVSRKALQDSMRAHSITHNFNPRRTKLTKS